LPYIDFEERKKIMVTLDPLQDHCILEIRKKGRRKEDGNLGPPSRSPYSGN